VHTCPVRCHTCDGMGGHLGSTLCERPQPRLSRSSNISDVCVLVPSLVTTSAQHDGPDFVI
jgi:hypothetical protein